MIGDLEFAIKMAIECHEGVIDKSGVPYIFHPLRVMAGVQRMLPDDWEAQQAAVLHDAKEDYPQWWRIHGVLFSPRVQKLVDILSRDRDNETYKDFINRVKNSDDDAAIVIKKADLYDNLTRPTPPELKGLKERYYKALEVLNR